MKLFEKTISSKLLYSNSFLDLYEAVDGKVLFNQWPEGSLENQVFGSKRIIEMLPGRQCLYERQSGCGMAH